MYQLPSCRRTEDQCQAGLCYEFYYREKSWNPTGEGGREPGDHLMSRQSGVTHTYRDGKEGDTKCFQLPKSANECLHCFRFCQLNILHSLLEISQMYIKHTKCAIYIHLVTNLSNIVFNAPNVPILFR